MNLCPQLGHFIQFSLTIISVTFDAGKYLVIILLNKEVNSIIELLQRGEKFEKMWGELEDFEAHKVIMIPDEYLSVEGGNMKYLIKLIKQRYFPKSGREMII